MKIAVYSTKSFDRKYLQKAVQGTGHELVFYEESLNADSAGTAAGCECVSAFVNDDLSAQVLRMLAINGVKLIALRCAGFNNVALKEAEDLSLTVVRVPEYSPWAVAEHTLALIMSLNRRVCKAHLRIREGNLSLQGLMGFELHSRTVGVVGTGRIGKVVVKILTGFECRVLAVDPKPDPECEQMRARYVSYEELFNKSDIITLHCPLMPQTHHLIDKAALDIMKDGVMIINTSRGALIDTRAVITAMKSGKVGYLGIDVYEEEADLFFKDLSDEIIQDDVFARLLMFPNVIVTGHQAFFTNAALENIAETTIANITEFEQKNECANQVTTRAVVQA